MSSINYGFAAVKEILQKAPSLYLFSVFPLEMKTERSFNGITTYILPAAKGQSDVTMLPVSNAFQLKPVGDGQWAEQPVLAEKIAEDLLTEFTSGLIGLESGHGPGVWIQTTPEPDPELRQRAVERQTAYFEFLVNQADGLHRAGKGNEISDLARAAARWLGYETYAWIEKMTQKALKECVQCYSRIDARATICPVCTSRQPGAAPAEKAAEKAAKKE